MRYRRLLFPCKIPTAMNPSRGARLFVFFLVVFGLAMPASAGEDAVAVVARMYRDYAWEAVVVEPSHKGLIEQPAAVLRRYFHESLVERLLADRESARKSHEIPKLDYLPIWASQDPMAYDLRVRATEREGVVEVEFRRPPGDAPAARLRYDLKRSAQGWRIADIRDENGASLYELLSP